MRTTLPPRQRSAAPLPPLGPVDYTPGMSTPMTPAATSPVPVPKLAPTAMYTMETYGELHPYLGYEWLLTNGLGGFASSTVVGCNTRRYHGLLVAALNPPVGRVLSLSRVGEILTVDGRTDHLLEFSVNQFRNAFHPRGDQYLRHFELGESATWLYDVEGVRVTKELLVCWEKNVTGIRYTVDAGKDRTAQLQLLPFTGLRDFHALRSAAYANFNVEPGERNVRVSEGMNNLVVRADNATFTQRGDWWYAHTYAIETERGQDDTEDLFCPGVFTLDVTGKGQVTLWASTESITPPDWETELAARPKTHVAPRAPEIKAATPDTGHPIPDSKALRRLARAAADFIVARKEPDGTPGCTVIAGYPWFADWGRDTMISLPGLFLTTGRTAEAGRVLSVFAQYVSEGMIPNRFDDYSNEPSYNTVDASLWFINACHEFLKASGDRTTFEQRLLPACNAILDGYQRGTRFGIKMDPADGLISAGDYNTQLTWMDAKCNGIAFTPRSGKSVEINALWYNALRLMGRDALADKVAESFVKQYWLSPFRGLYDVVGDGFRDAQVRPNQIFAVSLPHSPLSADQQQAVVEVVRRELLTPFGLRTLARGEAGYKGRYTGDQMARDGAYHNGAVWPWLIGAFLEAYLRVNDRSADARRQAKVWLQPLVDSMDRGCVGQIAEIFEGEEPHRPVGCCAQAWSVAEVLRLAVELGM